MRSLALPLLRAQTESAPYLGVEKSARGLKWMERLKPERSHLAMAIAQRYHLPEIVGRLLAARDVGLDDVPDVLNPTLRALCPDPLTLTDMDAAVDRLARAIEAREQVVIFGDYDVDGACASALLYRFLRWHGLEPRIYIPDRVTEGYGPNAAAMASLVDSGATLIVTVDCGSTSHDALEEASRKGVDVLVVDHHQVGAELPPSIAVVNPNRQDCLSGQGHLCAAGVVFLVCIALAKALRQRGAYAKGHAPNLLSWLDLVALATVCDVVPLTAVNRAFVVQGLKILANRDNVGLRALTDAAGVNKPPSPYTLGFILGPRINAGGRIGDAALGARLLTIDDPIEAGRIAEKLDSLNRERREIELRTVTEAAGWADRAVLEDPCCPIIIAGSPAWHKGLVGLAASRLTDRFQRPCLIFSHDERTGEATGSARSVAGVDIGAAVRSAVEAGVAKKGGGHAMAAGVTVRYEQLSELSSFLKEKLAVPYKAASRSPVLMIDGAISPATASLNFITDLNRAGPFGQGNPAPRLCLPAVRVARLQEIAGVHARCTLQAADGSQLGAVAFRAAKSEIGAALEHRRDFPIHVAGRLELNEWGGRTSVEFHIEDVAG